MPFSATDSLTSTNMNNMFRGLYRDNSDHTVTGTVAETVGPTTTVTANTIGSTGHLLIQAAGTCSGAGGTKTIKIYLGSVLASFSVASGSRTWAAECRVANTASNAQRIVNIVFDTNTLVAGGYTTTAVDTAADQTLKASVTLASAGDSSTVTMFEAFVCQIT